ncbi:FG-GAP repeat domain-containing protein [Planctomycetes bacterium Pla163]|uniref:FG-GAP repeat domain-containing protein n=1 Tax=Rohdeia mirabilis TaxID=2528008 RepID=UPI00119D5D3A
MLLDVPVVDASLCGVTFVAQGMIEDPNGPNGTAFTAGRRVELGVAGRDVPFVGRIYDFPLLARFVEGLWDLDGDGNLDVAGTTADGESIAIAHGDHEGGFDPPILIDADPDSGRVGVGDFDGDGTLDFVTANDDSSSLGCLLGQGSRAYQAPTAAAYPDLSFMALDLEVGDLDSDGHDDVVIVLRGPVSAENRCVVYWGSAVGLAGPGQVLLVEDLKEVEIADVDGDGALDIAVTWKEVQVLRNLGSRTFAAPVVTSLGGNISVFEFADWDGDGAADLVTFAPPGLGLYVRWGVGDGTFEPPVGVITAVGTWRWAFVDVEPGGHPELIVHERLEGRTTVLRLEPGRSVVVSSENLHELAGQTLSVADVDRDGMTDLVTFGALRDGITVHRGVADGGFEVPNPVTTMEYASRIGAADLDLDGDLDLVCTSVAVDALTIHLNDGEGGFSLPVNFRGLNNADRFVVARVDEGPVPDVLAIDNTGGRRLVVFLGIGDGAFTPPTAVDLESRPLAIAALDTHPERVVAITTDSATLELRSLESDGSLSAPFVLDLATGDGRELIFGDLDADGDKDLVVATEDLAGIEVFINDGVGGFTPGAVFDPSFEVFQNFGELALYDDDTDGNLDLLAGVLGPDRALIVVHGNGAGSFDGAEIVEGKGAIRLAVGDIDGDGWDELVTADFWTGDIALVRGGGASGLDARLRFDGGGRVGDFVIGDFNGDGLDDLAASNFERARIAVLLNRTFR